MNMILEIVNLQLDFMPYDARVYINDAQKSSGYGRKG